MNRMRFAGEADIIRDNEKYIVRYAMNGETNLLRAVQRKSFDDLVECFNFCELFDIRIIDINI